MIGYFVGKQPPFLSISLFCKSILETKDEVQIFSRSNGYYVLKFSFEEDAPKMFDESLLSGQLFFSLVLFHWDPLHISQFTSG